MYVSMFVCLLQSVLPVGKLCVAWHPYLPGRSYMNSVLLRQLEPCEVVG
jgi:hypothetical protein